MFEYIPTTRFNQGNALAIDMVNPTCSIEKFADPDYSILSKLESESETGRLYDEEGNQVPSSFINIKVSEPDEPQRMNYYIFTEAGINIVEPSGIMEFFVNQSIYNFLLAITANASSILLPLKV